MDTLNQKKREEREHLMRVLFCTDFHEEAEVPEQEELYFKLRNGISEDKSENTKAKLVALLAKKNEIDEKIETNSEGWKLNRMGKVELTILRIAVYEMFYDDDVPDKVAINEAVELAKKYGAENSSSFVNGILAKIIKGKNNE